MITKQYLYYFEEDVFMKIRNEINQGIMDAGLLEFDVICFLEHNGEWGPDGYPLVVKSCGNFIDILRIIPYAERGGDKLGS